MSDAPLRRELSACGVAAALRQWSWGRMARQWSGLVLFAFVLTHFLNHSAGIFGVAAMETAQGWRWLLWKSAPGSVLLYGAAAIHIVMTSWRVARRHGWRMTREEAAQIALGFSIPLLVAEHVLQTRMAYAFLGADESYGVILRALWPGAALSQAFLLLVAWTHGLIGLRHVLRQFGWYAAVKLPGLIVGALIPALALAGFVAAGREADASRAARMFTSDQLAELARLRMNLDIGMAIFASAFLGVIFFTWLRRRMANTVTIHYRGYGPVTASIGTSVLEASRLHGIPHPSVCHGRARCSTCRVQIVAGLENLHEPYGAERRLLKRIGALPNVRLACQIRPIHDITLRILMPVLGQETNPAEGDDASEWALERSVTILVLDLRAFNAIIRARLPYEVAVLVNRFASEMNQAVANHGGRVDVMYGNGLVAVFDADDDIRKGARAALHAASDMGRVLDMLNREMIGTLPVPVRAGIGVHSGPVILTNVIDGFARPKLLAMGETVTHAAALELASKELVADFVVSERSAAASGFDFSILQPRIVMTGDDEPISAYAVADLQVLQRIMTGAGMRRTVSVAGV